MAEVAKRKWSCPNCGAELEKHGEGGKAKCVDRFSSGSCQGLVCECDDYSNDPNHGETFASPCLNACCYHCNWSGELPPKPKKVAPWEKKALEAGWVPPEKRRKELGLG